ncbi:MAG: PKD domain-containing protein [Bacteroidia bacterium]
MNKIYKPLLFSLLMLVSSQTNAVDLLGSELRWKALGNATYEITAIIYTDCNGTTLGDTIEIKLQSIDSNHAFVDTIELIKVSSKDVTGQCTSIQTRCQASTSTFPYGIEKRIYVDTIDLSSQASCSFRISFSQCCREGMTYNSAPLYTYCEINSCDTFINSSPVLENDADFLIVAGQCYSYNFNGTDADGDSLVYSLVSSFQDSATGLTFLSPYRYDKPLYFNGFRNTTLPYNPPLCRGLHLLPESGDLMFRPMQAQTTWFAVEVTEYRGGTKIGSTRREWQQIITTDSSSNNAPIYTGSTSARVCQGDTLKFDFLISDSDSADTVSVSHAGLMPGASITYTGTGDSVYGHLEWIPQNTAPGRYPITIYARDNACPLNNLLLRELRVELDSMPSISYSSGPIGCGRVEFAAPVVPNIDYAWQVDTLTFSGTFSTYKFDSGGWKPFILEAAYQSCSTIFQDSVFVPLYQEVTVTVGPDTAVCWNDWFFLAPTVLTGNGGYSYLWMPDSITSEVYQGRITSARGFTLHVTDSVGCKGRDDLIVFLLAKPTITLKTIETCSTTDTLDLMPYASPSGGNWFGPGVSNNQLDLSQASFGDWLYYSYTDSNRCSNMDSVQLALAPNPVVSAGLDISVCQNSGSVLLNGSPANGTWSGTGVVNSGSQSYFNPVQAGAGNAELIYTFTDSLSCTASDTLSATVHPAPVVSVQADFSRCLNGDSVVLAGTPTGGSWAGAGIFSGIFLPEFAGAGNHQLIYSVTDTNSCTARDTVQATVRALPQVNAGNDINACKSGWPVQLKASPTGGSWLSPYVVAGSFYPALSGLGNFALTYRFTDGSGCTNTDSLLATVHDLPQVFALADTAVCIHESPINLAGQPLGGTWSGPGVVNNSFTPALAGEGKHKVIYNYAAQCANSDTSEIEVLPRPRLTASFNPLSTFQIQFTLVSPDSLIDFYWDFDDGNNASQRNPVHTYPAVIGNYSVIVRSTGNNSCWNADTLQVNIDNSAIKEIPWLVDVKIYPNPVTSKLTIVPQNGLRLHKAVLQNTLGEEVLIMKAAGNNFEGNVSGLAGGVYFLQLFNVENERAVVRVVVQ